MTLRRVLVATAIVPALWAGCSLQTSLTGGSSGPVGPKPTGSTRSTGSSSSSSGETPMAERERNDAEFAQREADRDRYIPGNANCEGANRDAWREKHHESCDPKEPLIAGLSIADAKKKIAATNANVKVKVVELYEFDKNCKADHVCSFSPRRWYVEEPREMELRVNRKLDIGPPAD